MAVDKFKSKLRWPTQDEQMANLLRMRGWKVEAPVPVGDETEALSDAQDYPALWEEYQATFDRAEKAEARVAGLETENKELRKAFKPFISVGPRILSIGSIGNVVEMRVNRETFEKARDLLYG